MKVCDYSERTLIRSFKSLIEENNWSKNSLINLFKKTNIKYKSGSGRLVIRVSDTKIWKIAYNNGGYIQNKEEIHFYKFKVYPSDKKYFASCTKAILNKIIIEQEYVVPLSKISYAVDLGVNLELKNILYKFSEKYNFYPREINDQIGAIGLKLKIYDYGYSRETLTFYNSNKRNLNAKLNIKLING